MEGRLLRGASVSPRAHRGDLDQEPSPGTLGSQAPSPEQMQESWRKRRARERLVGEAWDPAAGGESLHSRAQHLGALHEGWQRRGEAGGGGVGGLQGLSVRLCERAGVHPALKAPLAGSKVPTAGPR